MKLFPLLTSVIICALLLGCSGAPLTETFPTATPENADCAVDIWVAPEVPARVRENFVLPEG